MNYNILCGDALDVLKTLPDESVNMCVTSPPYFGLRDYGTGSWEGGDPNCDHKGNQIRVRMSINENCGTGTDKKNAECFAPVKTVCPTCGAVRIDQQIGIEETPEAYIDRLVAVFHEVKRVLLDDGTLWVNIGDSYWGSGCRGCDFTEYFADKKTKQQTSKGTIDQSNLPRLTGNVRGYKNKDLIGIPWMLAFALRADGWYLRQDIIWAKPNPMPESVKDRCTKAHEYIFLLSKSPKYYFDNDAIKETAITGKTRRDKNAEGYTADYAHGERFSPCEHVYGEGGLRNKRDVWSVSVVPYSGAHFATFPEKLIEPCILAGCPIGGCVLDPFNGAGTTGVVCAKTGRDYIGIELNPEYIKLTEDRLYEHTAQQQIEGFW